MPDSQFLQIKHFQVFVGALTQIRTGDLILTMDALCRLSYEGVLCGALVVRLAGGRTMAFGRWFQALCAGKQRCPAIYSVLERVKGIEPSQSAWEADVLPLNYTRKYMVLYKLYLPLILLPCACNVLIARLLPTQDIIPQAHLSVYIKINTAILCVIFHLSPLSKKILRFLH